MKALWFLVPVLIVAALLVFGRPLPVRTERKEEEGDDP